MREALSESRRVPQVPASAPRRRMEFELLESDVLESLEDLG